MVVLVGGRLYAKQVSLHVYLLSMYNIHTYKKAGTCAIDALCTTRTTARAHAYASRTWAAPNYILSKTDLHTRTHAHTHARTPAPATSLQPPPEGPAIKLMMYVGVHKLMRIYLILEW